ncbi:MAG: hypothetical protein CO093_03495 [Alphaproteobacteria bacterium CG_4_9_14_3_um_filter_47_13]|nr:MAG: hypothetical protein CO093_03495 [Alphaproteobacteria bacterium CG_4_9_14_3_um_filter_47_13]
MEKQETPYILSTTHKDGSRAIHVRDLTVRIPSGQTLVENVNLTLEKGERVLLRGESGTGKTTVAKSFLGHWDYGSGIITLPENIKIMGMAQRPYFPDVTLRGVLNLTPDDQCTLDDRDLTRVLKTVRLEKLIEHIPGQQTEILINDLLSDIEKILAPFAAEKITAQKWQTIEHDIQSRINLLVKEQFTLVQFTPETQRQYFQEKFSALLKNKLPQLPPKENFSILSNNLLDALDIALSRPLYERLSQTLPDLVEKNGALLSIYTPAEIKTLTRSFTKKLQKHLHDYIGNKDTDDRDRIIRINKTQIDHIIKMMQEQLSIELVLHNKSSVTKAAEFIAALPLEKIFNDASRQLVHKTFDFIKKPFAAIFNATSSLPRKKSRAATEPLRKFFNMMAWAPTRLSLASRASDMADYLTQNTTFFMARQVIKGDEFTNGSILSGGQKQKLLIATALLHKPDILIPDEITASLDPETTDQLYSLLLREIPEDTIVLSISHDERIIKYHTHLATLENKTITMEKITPDTLQAAACPQCPHKPSL